MGRNSLTPDLLQILASRISDVHLVTPGSEDYLSSIARWSDTAVQKAGAVTYPETAEVVSQLILFASEHNIDIAVKGGGHSTGGTSSTNGGLVIDLSRLCQVVVDENTRIITAEGGALWSDVDSAAANYGLATVGGTVNNTGIGGLSLGGGFGWLCGLHGPAIDNFVSLKVVLANGKIVNASSTEHADLFWAMRGAGHDFGIVVEFKLQAHPQTNPVYAGTLIFQPEKLGTVIEIINERHAKADMREAYHCNFAMPPGLGLSSPAVVVVCYYNGEENAAKAAVSSLLGLNPIANTLTKMPYYQLNGILNELAPPGGRKAFKGLSFLSPIRKEFVEELFREFTTKVVQEPDMTGTFLAIEYYKLEKLKRVPIHATSFPTRRGFLTGVLGLSWTNPTKDTELRNWGRFIQAKCRVEIHERDKNISLNDNTEYINYTEPGDLVGNVYGENQQRLVELKRKYDPTCLFNKMNLITPT